MTTTKPDPSPGAQQGRDSSEWSWPPLGAPLTASLAFVCGWGSLSTEMALLRLATPYVGSSQPVWSVIISVVLVSLALGAFFGGRLTRRAHHQGDKKRNLRAWLFGILLVSAVLTAAAPYLLGALARAGVGAGGLAAALPLALVGLAYTGLPVALLGSTTPVLVHLRAGGAGGRAGAASGLVAVGGTFGSLAGTLLPAFFMLPLLGTRLTFIVAAAALGVGALLLKFLGSQPPRSGDRHPNETSAASSSSRSAGAAGVGTTLGILLVAFVPMRLAPTPPGTIASAESTYNHLAVVERADGIRVLHTEAGWGEESYHDPDGRVFRGPWPLLAAAPLLLGDSVRGTPDNTGTPGTSRKDKSRVPVDVFMVGLGAGTAAQMLLRSFEGARVTGVELDPVVVQLAREHMGMDHPRLAVKVGDGRVALRRAPDRSLDVVVVDAFRKLYPPFHLATREFFGCVKRKLRPGGVMALNLVVFPRCGDKLLSSLVATIYSQFSHVYGVKVPFGANVVLFATDSASSAGRVRALRTGAPIPTPSTTPSTTPSASSDPSRTDPFGALEDDGHRAAVSRVFRGLRRVPPPQQGDVLTDDKAPVESLVHGMLWCYATAGG